MKRLAWGALALTAAHAQPVAAASLLACGTPASGAKPRSTAKATLALDEKTRRR